MDATGRLRGWSSSFDDGEKILLVQLPIERSFTLYAVVGDVFTYGCVIFLAYCVWDAMRREDRCAADEAV